MPTRQYTQEDIDRGIFDPLTMVESHQIQKDKFEDILVVRERSCTPLDFVLLFRLAGFKVEHIYGGTAGNWERSS